MRRVLLIFGNPGNGKSHVPEELAKQGYHHLSVDHTYADFFREKRPELYFPELRWFIAQHFGSIVNPREYTIHWLNRDYASEWHSHLLELVARASLQHDRLAHRNRVSSANTSAMRPPRIVSFDDGRKST